MRRTAAMLSLLSLVLVASFGFRSSAENPSRYLYVWGGTSDHSAGHDKKGISVVAVFDADPASKSYGSLVTVLTVDSAAGMPHHTEFSPPANATTFFANDFGADKSYLIDFSTPTKPRVAGRTPKVAGSRMMHSFARLPNGNVLATMQFGDKTAEGDPGALAEFDRNGKLVRSTSSADKGVPGGRIRTYGLTVAPAIDRVVTTSSPMDNEVAADVVQVWRLSTLELLKTLPVPQLPADSSHRYPFELRTMADGKTVFLNSYMCGFYRLTNLESSPTIERLMSVPRVGCSVPFVSGKVMVMPIAYAHRVLSFDISNPAKPVELASLQTDTTFFPHWTSGDPHSNRIVITDQGDGIPRIMIGALDPATGRITIDEKFRDPGAAQPGINFANVNWPNGVKGKVTPHGALFIK